MDEKKTDAQFQIDVELEDSNSVSLSNDSLKANNGGNRKQQGKGKTIFIILVLLFVIGTVGNLVGKNEDSDNRTVDNKVENALEDDILEKSSEPDALEIISAENHPRFFDKRQVVDSVWGSYLNESVIYDLQAYNHDVEQVAEVRFDFDSDTINFLWLNMDAVTSEKYKSLDEAVELVRDYIDIEILKNEFEYDKSYGFDFSEEKDYVIVYREKEGGKDLYVDIVTDSEDCVKSIQISDRIEPAVSPSMLIDDHYKDFGDRELIEWSAQL